MRSPDARHSLALFAPHRNPFTAALLALLLVPVVVWVAGLAGEGSEAAERDRLFEERLRNDVLQVQGPPAEGPRAAAAAEGPRAEEPIAAVAQAEEPHAGSRPAAEPHGQGPSARGPIVSPGVGEGTLPRIEPLKPLPQAGLNRPKDFDAVKELSDRFLKKMLSQTPEPRAGGRPLPPAPGGQSGR